MSVMQVRGDSIVLSARAQGMPLGLVDMPDGLSELLDDEEAACRLEEAIAMARARRATAHWRDDEAVLSKCVDGAMPDFSSRLAVRLVVEGRQVVILEDLREHLLRRLPESNDAYRGRILRAVMQIEAIVDHCCREGNVGLHHVDQATLSSLADDLVAEVPPTRTRSEIDELLVRIAPDFFDGVAGVVARCYWAAFPERR